MTVYDVCETCAYADVQSAIDDAVQDADASEIRIADGIWRGSLAIADDTTALALCPASGCGDTGANVALVGIGGPALTVDGAAALSIAGVSLSGDDDRALVAVDSTITLDDLVVFGSGTVFGDGGVFWLDRVELAATNVLVGQGRATGDGGLVWARDSEVYFVLSTLIDGMAAGAGGLAYATGVLDFSFSRLERGVAALGGGAVATTGGTALWMSVATVEGNECTDEECRGGGVWVDGDGKAPVAITSSLFSSNSAWGQGAGLALEGAVTEVRYSSVSDNVSPFGAGAGLSIVGGSAAVSDTALARNEASRGGAISLATGSLTLARTKLCENEANQGGALSVLGGSAVVNNTLFAGNTADDYGGAVYAEPSEAEVSISFENASFLGNTGPMGLATYLGVGVAVGTWPIAGEIVDSLFYGHVASSGAEASGDEGRQTVSAPDTFEVHHNLYWDNGLPGALVDTYPIEADPLMRSEGEGCDADGLTSYYGGAVDVASEGIDLDFSPKDVGMWGGLDAEATGWADGDEDGSPNLYDCEPALPDVHPGAEDVPYDGADVDCRGDDDYDADGDGDRPVAWGGTDCDDADPGRSGATVEIPDNGIDDDCNGWADSTAPLVPVGCTYVPRTGGWGLWALLVCVLARRRPERP